MNTLEVFGPFKIEYKNVRKGAEKQVDTDQFKTFWEKASPCATKQGCYVFALRAGRGYTPWYVGKTTRDFKHECFQPAKLVYYNDVLFHYKGTPMMFFIAKEDRKNKVGKEVISKVETFLIQQAYFENPYLPQKIGVKPPGWSIKGVIRGGQGRADAKATAFAKMMGL